MSVARCFFVHDESICKSLFANGSRTFRKISDELLEEKKKVIELQSNVIELRSNVIEKRVKDFTSLTTAFEKEMKTVQNVVHEEVKTYSLALSKTCAA